MELKIQGLDKTFEGKYGEPSFNLSLPDFSFNTGEIIFLMGQNGSGKSVTLKLIGGEILPSSNYVSITLGDLEDKRWQADKYPIPIVRQKAEQSLALDLTVEENLLIRLSQISFSDKLLPAYRLKERINTILSHHEELKRKKNQACFNLSGGQKQTLAFLSATINSFPILLLDEFLAATDSATSYLLREMTKKYAKDSPACVLIVSHDSNVALEDGDKIILLKKGKLLAVLCRGEKKWNKSFLIKSLQE